MTVGTSGDDVRELANLLIKADYITESALLKDNYGNVIYCINIANAVKKIQSLNNLKVDGIAGKSTINALRNITKNVAKPTTTIGEIQKIQLGDRILKKGMEGTDVTQLKNILIAKGYISDKLAKGATLFDKKIEKALVKFQEKIGIDADGILDVQTLYFIKMQSND